MNNKIIIFLCAYIVPLMLCTSCSTLSSDSEKSSSNSSSNPQRVTYNHNGVTREYLLHVPSSYDGSTEVPLMFNFHGNGDTAEGQRSAADMRSLSERDSVILIYPQGLNGEWNAYTGPDNKSSTDDFGFINALIEQLKLDYRIAADRIYACGYSNGAMFAYSLACYYSHQIAAIGSVSGTMLEHTTSTCNPQHPTAMINIHGSSDAVLPYDGSTSGFDSISNVLNYWTTYNNAIPDATETVVNSNGQTVERSSYLGTNNTKIEHYKVLGGGHVWFSGTYNGSTTSALVWDFLLQYNKAGHIN